MITRKEFEFAIDKCILQEFGLKASCAYSGKFLYISITNCGFVNRIQHTVWFMKTTIITSWEIKVLLS